MAATIYFAGGEDTSFTFVGTVSLFTDSSVLRSGWARTTVAINPAAAANPPTNRATSRSFVDKSNNPITPSNFWTHGVFAWGAIGGDVTLNCQMLRILDGSGNPRLCVRGAASGAAKISTVDITGAFVDVVTTGTSSVPTAGFAPATVDLNVVNNGTVIYGPRTDISFVGGSPGTISTASGDFATAGLISGSEFVVSGSAHNDGTYTATSATETSLVMSGATLTAESDTNLISFITSAAATLYFNAAPVATFASNTIPTNSVTTMAQVEIANVSADYTMYWSEVIVSDQPTLTKGLWTRPPTTAGAQQQWLPNTVGNIDKIVINDTTFISTTTDNEVSSWAGSTSAPSGSWLVDAIVEEARLEIDNTGPQHGEWVVQFGTSIVVAGNIAPTTTFSNFSHTWSENPVTTVDWLLTDITSNTLDIGVESLA